MTERWWGGSYILHNAPPNIWLETHSSLTASSSVPAQWGRREEKWRANRKEEKKQQCGPQMTRDPRLNQSSQSHIRAHDQRTRGGEKTKKDDCLFLVSAPGNDGGRRIREPGEQEQQTWI